MGKFQQQARFAKFTASHLENMENYMQQGADGKLEGGKWDGIDKITAKIAMAQIIHEIQAGKVDGKPYNPLADNSEMLTETLDKYMKQNRARIEQEVEEAQKKGGAKEEVVGRAIGTIDRKYNSTLQKICRDVQSAGGPEIKVTIPEIPAFIREQRRVTNETPSQTKSDGKTGWRSSPLPPRGGNGRD